MPEHVCHCSVKIEELSVRKGSTEILNQVNLTANHGEILALIGRNGAGKTTLLKAILGQTPYSGRISYFNCQGKRIDRPRIGYVPQFLAFDRSTPVTVEDLFCANQSRIPVWMSHGKKRQKEAESLLEKVGGTGLFRKKLGALSGGELQRVLLAFALDPLPDLLLLDEPTSGLDPVVRDEVLDLLYDFMQDENHAILLSSHITSDLDKIADEITFIHKGEVLLSEPRDELLDTCGILRCTADQLNALDPSAVRAKRVGTFGCEALVRRDGVPENWSVEPVNIEQIMLFLTRGEDAR